MVRYLGSLEQIRYSDLMELYEESIRFAAKNEYPHEDENAAVFSAQNDFYQYMLQIFFPTKGAFCAVWEVKGRPVSILRMEPYEDGLLLNGLETALDYRRRGYGENLVNAVLAQCGCKVYSHVRRTNSSSMELHKKAGFSIFMDSCKYLDGSTDPNGVTFVWTPQMQEMESRGKKG